MRPVTKDEFFKRIGTLNVHPQIQLGPYPYTSLWKMQDVSRRVIGKSADRHEGERLVTDYYLAE